MSDLLSSHFQNNQRCIQYGSQTGHVRITLDIYAIHTPEIVFQCMTTVMTTNIETPTIISNARPCMMSDRPFSALQDYIRSIYCYIYAVEMNQLPLKINEYTVFGDIARSMLEGKISRESLSDEWGSFTLPQFS